jgi:hypothetical protein
VRVRVVDRRAGSVQRGQHVVRAGRAGRLVGGHRLDQAALRRQLAEPARRGRLGAGDRRPRGGEQLVFASFQRIAGSSTSAREDLREVRRAEHARADRDVLLGEPGHLLQAGAVQVVGAAVGGGVHADQVA